MWRNLAIACRAPRQGLASNVWTAAASHFCGTTVHAASGSLYRWQTERSMLLRCRLLHDGRSAHRFCWWAHARVSEKCRVVRLGGPAVSLEQISADHTLSTWPTATVQSALSSSIPGFVDSLCSIRSSSAKGCVDSSCSLPSTTTSSSSSSSDDAGGNSAICCIAC